MPNNLHQRVFELMEHVRSLYPDFRYWLRQKDTNNRLSDGLWFQGTENYAFVGLYDRSGGTNRTRSIGLVFYPNDYDIACTFENVFNEEKDENILRFYEELRAIVGNFNQASKTKYKKGISLKDGLNGALQFIEEVKPEIDALVSKHKLNSLFISDEKFKKSLQKVMEIQKLSVSNVNEQFKALLVNITWNSNDWKAASEDKSGHKWVKAGNIAHESWNFDFENRRNSKYYVCGFAQFTHAPKVSGNKNLIIFVSQNKIVGFYGKTEVLGIPEKLNSHESYNLLAEKSISTVLINKIENIKEKGYLESNKKIGQIGFCYIEKLNTIKNIINEALELNSDLSEKLTQLLHWVESEYEIIPEINNTFKKMNIPLNQILYGPPGTGKTYKLQTDFINKFVVTNKKQTKEEFVTETIKGLSWWQIITLILLEGETTVPEIKKHKYIEYKSSVSNTNNLVANIWGTLQSRTIRESKTVSYNKRFEPLFLNKKEDSVWYIEESKKDLISDLIQLSKEIGSYKDLVVTENNWKFTTFHQSMSYEDFIEGIKPTLNNEDSENDVKYHIEKGLFYKCCDEAARLASFLSLKDALDNYTREQRKEHFSKANGYGLFIDEINRGNIAAIFGELITLIEDDKRLGENEIIVELPYSKEKFGVPSNLYIIGTMNTADRSVEALDAALRRRFCFTEISPKYDVEGLGQRESEILQAINFRIEKLIDKDHKIGHSYFLNIDKQPGLINAFYNKIIPLLQEYFYGDYGKIGLVLGNGFIRKKETNGTIEKFADFDYESSSEFENRDVFEIIDYRNLNTKHVCKYKNNNIEMNFENAIKLLLREDIE